MINRLILLLTYRLMFIWLIYWRLLTISILADPDLVTETNCRDLFTNFCQGNNCINFILLTLLFSIDSYYLLNLNKLIICLYTLNNFRKEMKVFTSKYMVHTKTNFYESMLQAIIKSNIEVKLKLKLLKKKIIP